MASKYRLNSSTSYYNKQINKYTLPKEVSAISLSLLSLCVSFSRGNLQVQTHTPLSFSVRQSNHARWRSVGALQPRKMSEPQREGCLSFSLLPPLVPFVTDAFFLYSLCPCFCPHLLWPSPILSLFLFDQDTHMNGAISLRTTTNIKCTQTLNQQKKKGRFHFHIWAIQSNLKFEGITSR